MTRGWIATAVAFAMTCLIGGTAGNDRAAGSRRTVPGLRGVVHASIRREVSQDSTSSSSQLDQLAHAEAKWQSSKIEAYEIQVQYACNALIPIAPPGVSSRLRFRVTGGESRLLGANETEAPVTGDLVQYSNVEQMFAFIRKARTSHPVRIETQYDEVRGYPTRVCVDPATTTDDEFGFVTSDFKVLRLRE